MNPEPPYNPLDKQNLGVSVADALLAKEVGPLPPSEEFIGAGIYAIYYVGDYPAYRLIADRNSESKFEQPIYVGKAVPAGARKGGFGLGLSPGTVLFKRLKEHAESIRQTSNLDLKDFYCRYLVVDDIWIPLGEALLIEMLSPVWNRIIDGFGNHAPGRGRGNQKKPIWDVLHPGRPWADKLQPNLKSEHDILANLSAFLTGKKNEVPQISTTDFVVSEPSLEDEEQDEPT